MLKLKASLCPAIRNPSLSLPARVAAGVLESVLFRYSRRRIERVHYQLLPFPTSGFRTDFNGSGTRRGWTAGAGVESAFSPTLSAFAEYDFMDFGNRGTSVIDGDGNRGDIRTSSVHLVKIGLNYKLGQGRLRDRPHAVLREGRSGLGSQHV
jgi:hypothetical protein